MSAPRLSLLLPCFNEEGNIPRLESELLPALDRLAMPFEVVAVDDGSSDLTAELLAALARKDPRVRMLRHPSNRGLGAALRTAAGEARGEWSVALDADLTFPPAEVAGLLESQRRTGADCVCGSPRYEGVPWTRVLPSRILNGLYRRLFPSEVTAYTPIFRLYRTELLRRLTLDAEGFEINAEILVRLLRSGSRVVESPARLRERLWGASKLHRGRELFRHLRLILRLILERA